MGLDDVHQRAQATIDRMVASGAETGVQVAVVAHGRVVVDAAFANRRDVLTSDIPSGGTMTARGAARLYAALLGHVPGVDLVSPARRAAMAAPAFEGPDEVMGMPTAHPNPTIDDRSDHG